MERIGEDRHIKIHNLKGRSNKGPNSHKIAPMTS